MVAQTPPALHVSVAPALKLRIDGEIAAKAIVLYFPKALRVSTAGLPRCDKSDDEIAAGACDGKRIGSGRVTIGGEPLPLTPLIGAGGLIFQASDAVFHGKLSRASGRYGSKLRVPLLDPGPALSDIRLSFKRSSLFTTRGCPLPFKLVAGDLTLTATASCTGAAATGTRARPSRPSAGTSRRAPS
jgi:hypothetical protein